MPKWDSLANQKTIEETVSALKANGIEAFVVENKEEAKVKVLELIPESSEVMTMTSVTLDTVGVSKEINDSGKYNPARKKLMLMDRKAQALEMNKLGAAPEYVVGSVHALTKDGKVLVASNSGSQIPAYAFGSSHVIWVVGAQKIVENLDEGIKRVYEHCLPLESERALKAYGVTSNVSKLLIINKEIIPGRISLIIVKEKLGF